MDIRKVKKLLDLVREYQLSEIEIKEENEAVRIVTAVSSSARQVAPLVEVAPVTAPVIEIAEQKKSMDLAGESKHYVESPMVGTVYLSANPGADPFVTVGQQVKAGDTLCLIEAMKTFNKIDADRAGVVSEILVKSGEPVEYGQPLVSLE